MTESLTEPLSAVLQGGHAASSVYLLLVVLGACEPGGWTGSARKLQESYRRLTACEDRPGGRSIQWGTLSGALGFLIAAGLLEVTRGPGQTNQYLITTPLVLRNTMGQPVDNAGENSGETRVYSSGALETEAPRAESRNPLKSADNPERCSGKWSTRPLPTPLRGLGEEGALQPPGALETEAPPIAYPVPRTEEVKLPALPVAARRGQPVMSAAEEKARRAELLGQLDLDLGRTDEEVA